MTRKIYRIHSFTPEVGTVVKKALKNFSPKNFDCKDGKITSARFGRFGGPTGLYLNIESSSGGWGFSPVMTDMGEISGLLEKMDTRTPKGLKGKEVTFYFFRSLAAGFSVRQ